MCAPGGSVVLVTAEIAALAAKVTPRGIRARVAKGTLTNHGVPGGPILVDVFAVADPHRGKGGGRPRKQAA